MSRNTFLVITVVLPLLLSGCATTSTPELVERAWLSGDWTAADASFNASKRAARQSNNMCPRGAKPWCVRRGGKKSCGCISDVDGRDRWESLWDQ